MHLHPMGDVYYLIILVVVTAFLHILISMV